MGGLGCYSLDGALTRQEPYGPVIAALAKQNFVTMRVEKTGEGDSDGPACTDPKATAELEAQGYIASLRALKAYEFVDPAKIFVFAHSLGPLIGSLVLPREPVRGFIAAETIGRSWFEYMLENVRRQFALTGQPPDQVDDEVRVHEKCAHEFFVLHHSADQVSRGAPQCAEMINSFAGVPSTFMHQVGDIRGKGDSLDCAIIFYAASGTSLNRSWPLSPTRPPVLFSDGHDSIAVPNRCSISLAKR